MGIIGWPVGHSLSPRMAETVSTNQFRNGMHIEIDGVVWRIVDFQHVKPGKGGAFVRTKLKALESGSVVDRTFRAGEKFARVHTEVKNLQFLYDDGSEAHFMARRRRGALPATRQCVRVRGSTPSMPTPACSPISSRR